MPMATASTPRDLRRGFIAIAALVVTAAVIFGLTYDGSKQPTATATSVPDKTTTIVSDTRHRFGSLAELVRASDLVVSGRIVAAEAGRVFGGEVAGSSPAAIRSHVLTVQVDSILAGAHAEGPDDADAGDAVLVEEEAELTDGTPIAVDGMRAGRVGDDGIWFLVASRDPEFPGYAVVNSQGRYLRDAGGALHGGDTSDGLVQELAHGGPTELADAVAGIAR
jgi:hypothetical protein